MTGRYPDIVSKMFHYFMAFHCEFVEGKIARLRLTECAGPIVHCPPRQSVQSPVCPCYAVCAATTLRVFFPNGIKMLGSIEWWSLSSHCVILVRGLSLLVVCETRPLDGSFAFFHYYGATYLLGTSECPEFWEPQRYVRYLARIHHAHLLSEQCHSTA